MKEISHKKNYIKEIFSYHCSSSKTVKKYFSIINLFYHKYINIGSYLISNYVERINILNLLYRYKYIMNLYRTA